MLGISLRQHGVGVKRPELIGVSLSTVLEQLVSALVAVRGPVVKTVDVFGSRSLRNNVVVLYKFCKLFQPNVKIMLDFVENVLGKARSQEKRKHDRVAQNKPASIHCVLNLFQQLDSTVANDRPNSTVNHVVVGLKPILLEAQSGCVVEVAFDMVPRAFGHFGKRIGGP
jgi:hypothetical protein